MANNLTGGSVTVCRLIVLMMMLIAAPLFAQQPPVTVNPTAPQVVTAQQAPQATVVQTAAPKASTPSDIDERLTKVETTLSLIRDYNGDFLAVLLWALGALGTMTVVLIGLNWFQSNRTLKRDFDTLKAEFHVEIDAASAKSVKLIEERLDDLAKNMREIATEVANEKTKVLRSRVSSLREKVYTLEFKRIESEVNHWLQTSVVPLNAISTCKDLIECAISLNTDWRTSNAIDLLNKSINAVRADNSKIDAQELIEWEEVLGRVPAPHKTAVDAVFARLKKLHS